MGIPERLCAVRGRIAGACSRCGRDPSEVTIVAVAKTHGPDAVREAAGAGIGIIGENRVQEAIQKMPQCPSSLRWHMVGHLQSNKSRVAVSMFDMIHSVDSVKLLDRLDRDAEEEGRRLPVCLEVNVSGESSKFGLAPGDVPAVLEAATRLRWVEVVGLMTIPPFTPEPEGARPFFRRLREFREGWRTGSGMELGTLSMGMSNDFEVAVEEGATIVRLGTVLFGERARRESDSGEG
jgi:pyridoxal phosphate enzyme (YggS family)